MKVSEELPISFWLRKFETKIANKKFIMKIPSGETQITDFHYAAT
ncbi:hypothetical protein SAMN05428988_1177 [Chitinophaga sp. YR573]|nr:hypothetical protein SAMN05428988_1177 [Chitinophaga sp. YR573]